MLDNRLIIFDGAMGSMLNNYNLMGECNELYNLTHPNIIMDIHKSYYNAGVDYIKTNTFGASPLKLRHSSNDNMAYEINHAGYQLARKIGMKVCGDIGPSGELYAPMGDYSTLDIYNSYLVQALALKECDCILIETMSSIVEANLAYMAIREYNKDIPIIISFTFDNGYTMMGNTPQLVANAFNATDIAAIGTNCSGGPIELLHIVKELSTSTDKRICVMPNAGIPSLQGDETIYPFNASEYKKAMVEHINNGASIIGGCCGTTPEHIEALMDYKSIDLNIISNHPINPVKYIATEREYASLDRCEIVSADEKDILDIEDSGYVARIDVSDIDDITSYINDINTLNNYPKCFIATKDQVQLIQLLYHGITDIIVK